MPGGRAPSTNQDAEETRLRSGEKHRGSTVDAGTRSPSATRPPPGPLDCGAGAYLARDAYSGLHVSNWAPIREMHMRIARMREMQTRIARIRESHMRIAARARTLAAGPRRPETRAALPHSCTHPGYARVEWRGPNGQCTRVPRPPREAIREMHAYRAHTGKPYAYRRAAYGGSGPPGRLIERFAPPPPPPPPPRPG